MEFKKADWILAREAETQGLMVAMTGLVERIRTDTNKVLSEYFRAQLPDYRGSFDEYEGEKVLDSINAYLEENDAGIHALEFPVTSGSNVHLIPINENIQLKMIIADEYHGDGEYDKYVMAEFFLMKETATKEDVDVLIAFIKQHLLSAR